MLETIKRALVGRNIEDIGTVNRGGRKHAMIRLTGNVVVYALWDEVETVVTTLSRQPMGSALTSQRAAGKLKAS